MKVFHEFAPYINKNSKILILGSIPSVKSRELGFYYMHPQNRFWKVLSLLFGEEIPKTINDKKEFLNKHKIALWDVLESCDIDGSSDSSIKNPKVNDIKEIVKNTDICKIFVTGTKAFKLYNKYCFKEVNMEAICLPSTSAANCRLSESDLVNSYKIIIKYLKK